MLVEPLFGRWRTRWKRSIALRKKTLEHRHTLRAQMGEHIRLTDAQRVEEKSPGNLVIDRDRFAPLDLSERYGGVAVDGPEQPALEMILVDAQDVGNDGVERVLVSGGARRQCAAQHTTVLDRKALQLATLVAPAAQQELRDIMVLHAGQSDGLNVSSQATMHISGVHIQASSWPSCFSIPDIRSCKAASRSTAVTAYRICPSSWA